MTKARPVKDLLQEIQDNDPEHYEMIQAEYQKNLKIRTRLNLKLK